VCSSDLVARFRVLGLLRVGVGAKGVLGGLDHQVATTPVPQNPILRVEAVDAHRLDVRPAVRSTRREVRWAQAKLVEDSLEDREKHLRCLRLSESVLGGPVALDLGGMEGDRHGVDKRIGAST